MNYDPENGKRKVENGNCRTAAGNSFFAICRFPFSILRFPLSLRLGGLIFLFAFGVSAQDLPDEIRGYKVHRAKVSIENPADKIKSDDEDPGVAVKFGEPELVRVSPLGTTFEIFAEISVSGQRGKIDFLSFRDFRVNGLSVRIEEYKESFEIEKNRPVQLKKPIRIFVPVAQSVKGGLQEIFAAKEKWDIAGRVFVFGRFKKFGFNFKRVVPVDAEFKIENPLRQKKILPFPSRSN